MRLIVLILIWWILREARVLFGFSMQRMAITMAIANMMMSLVILVQLRFVRFLPGLPGILQ
jgi:hypothetical protein